MKHVSDIYTKQFFGGYVTLEQELEYIHEKIESVNDKLTLLLDHLHLSIESIEAHDRIVEVGNG